VTKAHQTERIVLVLGALDVVRDLVGVPTQHVEACFVRAAMGRAPQAGDTGRDASERVGARRTGQTHGRGRGVLLVVGVQDEDAVHRLFDGGDHFIFFGRNAEGHAQEVAGIGQLVVRIDEGWPTEYLYAMAAMVGILAIRRWANAALHRIGDVGRVVIEGRARRPRRPSRPSGARRGGSPEELDSCSCTMVWRDRAVNVSSSLALGSSPFSSR
jgi:hypothetical protein